MSKLVQINVIETRTKSKISLELTESERSSMILVLDAWRASRVFSYHGEQDVHNILKSLRGDPVDIKEERIER